MRGPHVRFRERRGGVILRAYSTAAEDGGGESFLPREEWASAQGKKVDPTPLRLRRSRRSRPSARSSQGEVVWSARRTAFWKKT
jgi:hypothetical protein